MATDIELIKKLRERTGAGVMDCKNALAESASNLEQAEEILKSKGAAKALKRSDKETREGIVATYIHSGNKIGALVELNCETDFVARTTEFQQLGHDLAMQIAAMAPEYISSDEINDDDTRDSINICLMQQIFIKDSSIVIEDLIRDSITRTGENIKVRRFARFALGD
tara:strand:- start:19 stop:522 length:504 start_codon:yes stop_codon:yes gene_type:complete